MEYVLIGTAGHVDHGKSTLIKALSGIDPLVVNGANLDRLKEEKDREMTIDIGFANFPLPSGRLAQVIDVPGHERFVKNMLAGVNTIDIVLLVVDANEGVKPQTKEHFGILKLLEIQTGIIVLTKIDITDPARLAQTINEVAGLVKDSFLAVAPVLQVSSVTGAGITELVAAIDRLAPEIPRRDCNLPVRLPIDRVFTISGSGTVITGTLVSGVLRINDELEILPRKTTARVRQIQSYGGKNTEATAGQRIGLNLAGVKKEDLIRGNTLAAPGYIEPTTVFDAMLTVLSDSPRPLKNLTRVRLHIGTGEFLGRVVLLDKDIILPGENGLAQFRSESELAITKNDRFIIRFYAPMVTAGGGRVLDAHPVRHKRFQADAINQLSGLATATASAESVVQVLLNAGIEPMALADIATRTNLPRPTTASALQELAGQKLVLRATGQADWLMHIENFNLLKERIIETLADLHRKTPLKLNAPLRDVRQGFGRTPIQSVFFDMALTELVSADRIIAGGAVVRLKEHTLIFTPRQEQLRQRIESLYLKSLFAPGNIDALATELSASPKTLEEIVNGLIESGVLLGLTEGIIMHSAATAKSGELLRGYFLAHENIKAGEFAKLLNTSRKYAIPLLEYLDSIRLTKRVGDVRILNK